MNALTRMRLLLILFWVLSGSSLHAEIIPANGLWGTTDNPAVGSGLMLTTQGGITAVSVFTYDETGRNVWYLASGSVVNGVFEAGLLQATGGSDLMAENPQSAEFLDNERSIRLTFTGSQTGTVSIDGSAPKAMQTSHFGFYEIPTEQVLLADGTPYRFPDLSGDWVIGDADSGESYILSLENLGTGASPPNPNFALAYLSDHPSTDSWSIYCPQRNNNSVQPYCSAKKSNVAGLPPMRIDLQDLGNQRFTIIQDSEAPFETYQAFRLSPDRRLLPHDGYWRLFDDPGIGSGLVLRTQGAFTVALVYTYAADGQATWGIASGQVDANGLMQATLNVPQGGSPIHGAEPVSATFDASSTRPLTLQMQGGELGQLSLDGLAPKNVQNFNFGALLHPLVIFQPSDEPFALPDQQGLWLLVDEDRTTSDVWHVFPENPNRCQSPPDPLLNGSLGYSNGFSCFAEPEPDFENPDFLVIFNCLKRKPNLTFIDLSGVDFCYGTNAVAADLNESKLVIFYDDIGVNEFRYHVGPPNPNEYFAEYFDITRESPMYQLFRLRTD
jgi:hypothetical protein